MTEEMLKEKNFIQQITQGVWPYVIAEIGINHNGNIGLAKEMIDAAAESGADCVKFQSFKAEKYISPLAGKAGYQEQEEFLGQSQRDIIKACEISIEQAEDLRSYSRKKNVQFLSTPFEVWSLRGLVSIGLDAIKISSCNLTNIPFLEEAADSKIAVLLSTGMGSLEEVIKAVEIFKRTNTPLMIFQCTSNYPSLPENANLRVIETYRNLFDIPVGLSDHTTSNITCIAAVALGAVAFEKHFTISRNLPGIDQKASMEPNEFGSLVKELRECRSSLGSAIKFRTSEEESTAMALRRSLVAAKDLTAGMLFDSDCVISMRPGTGLSPDHISNLIGRRLTRDVKVGVPISLDDF